MDGAIIDLDGTVYRSETVIPGACEGIEELRDAGVDIAFVTNSSTKTTENCQDRLASLGIEAAVSEILTSASVTAEYVDSAYPNATVMLIGNPALSQELRLRDVALTDEPAETDVLVVGKDTEFDFETLSAGLQALKQGATFVVTNDDRSVPTDAGLQPGAGALIAAIAYAASCEPDVVCGKPHEPMIEASLDTLGAEPGDCLVVGDNPETDIEMGRRAGMTTVLVLTGLVDRDDPVVDDEPADHVVESLLDVHRLL